MSNSMGRRRHPPMFRVWYFSNMHEQHVMMPVYTLTNECGHKDGRRIFVETDDVLNPGFRASFRIDNKHRHRDSILMMNSGIRDCQGKPIFEGDVLQTSCNGDPEWERAICFYDKGTFSLTYWSKVVEGSGDDAHVVEGKWWGEGWEPYMACRVNKNGRFPHWKVIGNVCENPELLGIPREEVLKATSIKDLAH